MSVYEIINPQDLNWRLSTRDCKKLRSILDPSRTPTVLVPELRAANSAPCGWYVLKIGPGFHCSSAQLHKKCRVMRRNDWFPVQSYQICNVCCMRVLNFYKKTIIFRLKGQYICTCKVSAISLELRSES